MIVDKVMWQRIDFETKATMARTVVCMLTEAERGKTARVEVRNQKDHSLVGQYNGVELAVP